MPRKRTKLGRFTKGKRKGKKKRKGSKSKSSGKPTMKIGASYTAGRATALLLSPATDAALASSSVQEFSTNLRGKAITPYVIGVGILGADTFIDKKMGQAGALSRGSVTAWAPEGYLGLLALDEFRAQGGLSRASMRTAHQRLGKAIYAYDPAFSANNFTNPEFHTYRTLKHGLQAVRWATNRTSIGRRITRPVKRFVGALGASA